MKIAIIEDELEIAQMYEAKLKREGFEVLLAANGGTGLALILEYGPDVALLDLMMPEMDGYAVLESLGARGSRPTTKVVVLTNMGDAETQARVIGLGAVDCIVKAETTPRELAERVRQLLEVNN
jgi:DNA-binding response OmpR family regulator